MRERPGKNKRKKGRSGYKLSLGTCWKRIPKKTQHKKISHEA